MADKGPIWGTIVEKNGLQKFRFEEIAAWGYPDGVFASDYDIVSDTSKVRRFGFHDLVDTEEMFLRMFSDFRRERIIPGPAEFSRRRLAQRWIERSAIYERFTLRSMDHIAVSLAPGRPTFGRAHVQRAPTSMRD